MYPPTGEPDSARIARNHSQSRWVVPALYLTSGLLAVALSGAPGGWPGLGVSWLALGVIGLTLASLEHRRPAGNVKWFRIGAVLVYAAAIVLCWIFRA